MWTTQRAYVRVRLEESAHEKTQLSFSRSQNSRYRTMPTSGQFTLCTFACWLSKMFLLSIMSRFSFYTGLYSTMHSMQLYGQYLPCRPWNTFSICWIALKIIYNKLSGHNFYYECTKMFLVYMRKFYSNYSIVVCRLHVTRWRCVSTTRPFNNWILSQFLSSQMSCLSVMSVCLSSSRGLSGDLDDE